MTLAPRSLIAGFALASSSFQAAFAGGPCHQVVQETPPELGSLKARFTEIILRSCVRDSTVAQRAVAEAQRETAAASTALSVNATSHAGVQQTWSFADGTQTNKDDSYTRTLTAGVEASKSLWNGGVDGITLQAAEARVKSAGVDERGSQAQLLVEFSRELLKILNSHRLLVQREKELEKWRTLNTFTRRKAAGGHLSQRDTLQSDKETSNAENEVDSARRALERDLGLLKVRYDLQDHPITLKEIPELESSLAPHLDKTGKSTLEASLPALIAAQSSELQRTRLQREAASLDAEQRRRQILAPDLRAVAGWNAQYIDNSNRETVPSRGPAPELPNWSTTANLGLRFSLSLWNPRAEALQQESLAQQAQFSATEAQQLRNIQVQSESWKSEWQTLAARLEGQRRVMSSVKALADGNNQLYEAGLVDTFQIIRGLQDLYSQERTIMELENQMRTVAFNVLLARTLGRL